MNKLIPNFKSISIFLSVVQFCLGEHIVFLHTCASYSHRVSQWPLAMSLAEKGHNVTFISPYGPSSELSSPKVTEIQPQDLKAFMNKIIEQNFDVNHRAYGLVPPLFMVIDYFCYSACHEMYKSEEIKAWIASNPQVDLVVADTMADCSYGLAHKFDAKTILYQPIPVVTKHFESFGINAETESLPDYDVSKPTPLTFFSRVAGAMLPLWYRVIEPIFHQKYKSLFSEELGLTNLPDVHDMRELTSLMIINGDYLSDYPRSFPPFVVKVPGIHLKKTGEHKPLKKEIEDFIHAKDEIGGNKTEGFIYISFGTVAKAPNLPIELREIFLKTIKSFPHRFIWKWEGGKIPEEYPSNLLFVEWVDQQDVLAHPKIKAFLTQAGRPSFQEALGNGVPTITFPVLADQDFNAHRMRDLGISIGLDFVGLTQEKLTEAISRLLTDDSYKKRSVQLAKLSKDVPMDPVDTALWWTEFVLRHTKEELELLKPLSRHLTWYQKRGFDVWLFLFGFLSLSTWMTYVILCRIYASFFGNNNFSSIKLKKS